MSELVYNVNRPSNSRLKENTMPFLSKGEDGESTLRSANSKFSRGDFRGSIKQYKKYIGRHVGEQDLEFLGVLQNLGVCHKKIGDFDNAIKYYEQALLLARELKIVQPSGEETIKAEEANALSNIGVILKSQGQELWGKGRRKEADEKFKRAEEYLDQAMGIDLAMENYKGVASSLLNLGNLYKNQLMNSKAIGAFKKCIEYSEKIQDKVLMGSALCGIGNVHLQVEEFDEAIEKYQAALSILASTSQYDTQWLIDLTQANMKKAEILKTMKRTVS